MKATLLLIMLLVSSTGSPAAAKEYPTEIGGLKLGGDIKNYEGLIRQDTMMPLRFSPYLQEVETVHIPGFDYGLLWVGACADPGRILRIRMKYQNSSESFYEKVLQRLKARYGDPEEWRGDPFHTIQAWKWSFVDNKGNTISMILEHNTQKESETIGNTLKITMWNLVESENACYREKNPKKEERKTAGQPDWNLLIPK